jgi:ABC-type uncharacterized transport system involved in gliding motility auxiliary subunit
VALMATKMDKTKTGANAIAFVAITLLALLAVNVIANRYFTRVDFTRDKVYTLSQASKDVVKNLPDRMTVKAFISSDLQPPFSQVAQYVRDVLDEYATASKGKLHWEAVDPAGDSKLEEEAQKMKVPKAKRGRISSGKVAIADSYLGIGFQYQGNIESIPEINSPEGLEYAITSLVKMMSQHKKKVAFATSEGEMSPTGGDPRGGGPGLQFINQFMKDYDVTTVNLTQGAKPIADDVDALVIAGPKQSLTDRAKFVVDQFLMKGKSVAFLVDGMVIEQPRGMMMPGQDSPRIGRKNETGLDDLLDAYGFKVRDDLILEPRQNVPGPVPVQGQMLVANYYTFVAATDVDKKHGITEGLQGVILPFPSSVELVKDKQPGLSYTALVRSTKDAWRQSGFFLFDPQNNQLKIGDDRGPFTFAYAAKGKLKSAFAGKPYPNEKGEKVPWPDANASSPENSSEKPLEQSQGDARIVVIGDSDFASDEYLRMVRFFPGYQANAILFMNMLDDLAQDAALAPVRAKGLSSRPLTVGSDVTPALVKYANTLGVPLAFILFGVVRWRVRGKRRRAAKI